MAMTTDRHHVRMTAPVIPALLSGFTSSAKKLILESAELRRFRSNSIIINSGDPATRLFLLRKGRVKYYRVTTNGQEVLLLWVSPGEIFGTATLLGTPQRYIGTAEAIGDCELLVWSRKKIRRLAAAHDHLSENILAILMHYLSEYAGRIVGLVSQTAENRLAHTLLRLGERTGHVRPDGVEVAITNAHLGGLADVGAFTTSRQLKQWERRGVLKKARGKIQILSPEGLLID